MVRQQNKKIQETWVFKNVFSRENKLNGLWNHSFFKNNNPISVEIGCGNADFIIEMARNHPSRNFIGVDVKGPRIWYGAKAAIEGKLANVGFLRIRIEFIKDFFAKNEIDEIWITFPDPFLTKRRDIRRLTSGFFLKLYNGILKKGGIIHLKTDSQELFNFSEDCIIKEGGAIHIKSHDIYNDKNLIDSCPILNIKTKYEKKYIACERKIKYLRCSFK